MSSVENLLKRAMKALTSTTLGESVLAPEQRDRFIAAMETRAPLLALARFVDMGAPEHHIDRWAFTDRILGPPAAEGEAFTGESTPETNTNILTAQRVRGKVRASDTALLDSIAKTDAADQLVALIGGKAGVDLEDLFLNGDTGSGDPYLALLDGWLVRAEQQLTGVADEDFDSTDVEDMFEALLLSIEPRFLTDRTRWRYAVPFQVENDYRNLLRARGTELGDQAQIGNRPIAYKGIPLVEVPTMPGGTVLLTSIDNTVWGIRSENLEIEDERVASADSVDFHVRARGDANYEDENGAATAVGYVGP